MAKKYTAETFEGDVTGNVTGSASLNVLKAGDTMTGQLRINKSGTQLQVDNSGDKFLEVNNFTTKIGDIDGVVDEGYVQMDGSNSEFILFQGQDQRIRLDANSNITMFGQGTNNASGAELNIRKGQSNEVEGNIIVSYGTFPNSHLQLQYEDPANDNQINLYGEHTYFNSPLRIGANASANELDDYEEGSFGPTFYGTSGLAISYDTQVGRYVKVGRVVHVFIELGSDAVTYASGNLEIHGLPFAADDLDGAAHPGLNYSFQTSLADYTFVISENNSKINIYLRNGTTQYQANQLGTGTNANRLRLVATYITTT